MKVELTSEILVLREIASAVVRERNVHKLLEEVIGILERSMGMLRGTFTLLEGDELKIEASARGLNSEERALGRYRVGEGITGLVAKTGRSEVVMDVRQDRRFLNRTRARKINEPLSFVCVPLVHGGQVIGTLSVDRKMTGNTSELARDVALLEIIANLCAEAANFCRCQLAEREALRNENDRLRGMLADTPSKIVGNSPAMRSVFEQIRLVAPSDATVLIRGASGTGKELVAKAIQGLSSRKDHPFIVLNCAALPEALVESELFGHEKGAFTDARELRIGRAEAADGGTLFLDEVGDLSVPVQVKLLRFLQERTFCRVGSNVVRSSDVRFIAATSRNLEELMAKKLFREDLYYRLSVFPIALPDLARRPDDVLPLAQYFLSKMCLKYGKAVSGFSVPATVMLQSYAWPGNVRELENCIERAVLTAKGDLVHGYDLPPALQVETFSPSFVSEGPTAATMTERVEMFERRLLAETLKRYDGNQSAAGRELGLSPRMMCYKLKRLGLVRSAAVSSAAER